MIPELQKDEESLHQISTFLLCRRSTLVLSEGEKDVLPAECLVFEDSVLGIESGRRAGMRCIWVPHPELHVEYNGREKAVLAGKTGEGGQDDLHQLGEEDDGWADYLVSLEDFPYEKYGMVIPA